MIVIDAQGLAASRPNRPLFTGLSITVSTGDRIGVVCLNGCGKSTLLRILTGDLQADAGELILTTMATLTLQVYQAIR